MGTNFKRIIADLILLLGLFISPWWCFAIVAGVAFIYFAPFYEGLLLGLVADLIYFVPRELFFNLPLFFVAFAVWFVLCQLLHKQLRLRN